MPLLIVARLIASLASLAVLGAALYLGWSWYEGEAYVAADGRVLLEREDWRLWTAIALLAWSLAGRFILTPLLGRPDSKETLLDLKRRAGEMIDTPTGASVYVERHGDPTQPVLIFTHGWGLDSTIWAYAKRELASDFHVVVWDLPGLGRSSAGVDSRLGPTRFAEDLQAVIDHVGADEVVLIGHSIGGMTIQSLVRDGPQELLRRVRGIVLLNTTYTNPLRTAFGSSFFLATRWILLEPMLFLTRILSPLAWLDAWRAYLSGWAHLANRIQFGRTVTRSQLNAVTLLGTRNSQGALARGNQDMFRWDATEAMSGFDGPVLVIGGKVDLATRIEASRQIAHDARSSHLVEVEAVNHNGFLENWATYHRAIADFVGRLPSHAAAPVSAPNLGLDKSDARQQRGGSHTARR